MNNTQPENLQPEAFALKDFCKLYAVGETKAHEEIRAGRLKTVRLGAKHLVPRASAQAWLNSLPSNSPIAA